jgi:hypothetical protein
MSTYRARLDFHGEPVTRSAIQSPQADVRPSDDEEDRKAMLRRALEDAGVPVSPMWIR